MKRAVLIMLVIAVAFGSMAAVQRRLDSIRGPQRGEQLLYLPNEHLLEHFTAGMSGVISSLLWVQCLMYTGRQFRSERDFRWLNHMCEVVTRLDPYFVDAHRYGAVFLAMLKADDEACIRLLEKGIANNPDAWELPYELAMTYLLNRPDKPDSPVHAARYLAMAIKTGNAPGHVLELAQNLQRGHNLVDIERDMWESMLKKGDSLLHDVAERKLTLIELRTACDTLNRAASRYEEKHGAPPATIAALVAAGLVPHTPADPLGGSFFIDADGLIKNTSVLDEQAARARTILRGGIDAFKERFGRWPESLEEMTDIKFLTELPRQPYATREWRYDPKRGTLD